MCGCFCFACCFCQVFASPVQCTRRGIRELSLQAARGRRKLFLQPARSGERPKGGWDTSMPTATRLRTRSLTGRRENAFPGELLGVPSLIRTIVRSLIRQHTEAVLPGHLSRPKLVFLLPLKGACRLGANRRDMLCCFLFPGSGNSRRTRVRLNPWVTD